MSDLIDGLIECARLLGVTQGKKGFGCYTREDARFERAMHESISDKAKRLTAELAKVREDAERYRWIAGHCRSTSEHWGGRWSIIVDGPCPTAHDDEDAFDAAIDAARSKEHK